ncbi:hypothetical protein BDW59DRAFT_164548 [Aspergillus cavernicola]|uniref:Epidermal growth factor receptor-like transmembrane-juxtamembrane segment domain-containing protein n=1 Tax=Aspergillus cavernicola TaxID=176166 RepID=A0ABR4HZE2_9EURO
MATITNSIATRITTTFVPPPDEPSIVGYFTSGAVVRTISCGDDYEFLVSSTYGICCAVSVSGNCQFRQSCQASMVIDEDGLSYTCYNNNACVETTIFQQELSAGWSATIAGCVYDEDDPTTIYRSFVGTQLILVPADSIATTTSLDPETTDETTGNVIHTIATVTTSEPILSTTASTNITSSSEPQQTGDPELDNDDRPNVGAIAGGVVGGVVVLVLIIFAAWFVMRRQKKKDAELMEIGTYVAPEAK